MPTRRYAGAVRKAQLELQAPQLHAGNVEEVELLAALLVVDVGFLQGHPSHDGSRGAAHAAQSLVRARHHMEIGALVIEAQLRGSAERVRGAEGLAGSGLVVEQGIEALGILRRSQMATRSSQWLSWRSW